MKIIKERARTISTAYDERCQVLPSKIIWDRTIDRFEVFRNNVKGHYGKIGAGYLFDSSLQEAYLEKIVECYNDFWMEYLLLSRSSRMHAHCMANFLLNARVA
jgi:hypothetical protein